MAASPARTQEGAVAAQARRGRRRQNRLYGVGRLNSWEWVCRPGSVSGMRIYFFSSDLISLFHSRINSDADKLTN